MDINRSLFDNVVATYKSSFGVAPDLVAFAPGRINLIGEHTDYNDGFVMPGAVRQGIYFAIGTTPGARSEWIAMDPKENYTLDISKSREKNGSWADFIYGAWQLLSEKHGELPGFNCAFGSDLPAGSGMSSSSALTCGILLALSEWQDIDIAPVDLALNAHAVESGYIGVSGGIMDQFACLLSKPESLILLDCRDQSYQSIQLEDSANELFLIHSNVHRKLTSSGYNTRTEECKLATALLNEHDSRINSLRDIASVEEAKSYTFLDETLYKRVVYVTEENARVLKAVEMIGKRDWAALGNILYEGHEGLSKLYEVSIPEIDFLVDFTRKEDWILGGRLMGGGFGGCTINFATTHPSDDFMEELNSEYQRRFNTRAHCIRVNLGNSARRLD